ncbi:MAG: hypothetical protein Ct9H300mP19_15210 [Dehalococcoidia bacterium]|nr:MAG: hypothetical protein Ct9H300mP19_15210 [Dehalococcoidia bacterium]
MWRRFEDDLQTDFGWFGEVKCVGSHGNRGLEFRSRIAELREWGYSIREISPEEAAELEPVYLSGILLRVLSRF